MKRFAFFVALLLSSTTHSFAESYEETFARFAEVSGLSESFDLIIDEQYLAHSLEQQAVIMIGADFSKNTKARLVGAIREVFQKAKPEYEKYLFEAYKKHYSQGELAELIAFYSTPVGKKMAKLQNTLTKEGAIAGEKIISKYQPQIIERLEKLLESAK